MSSPKKDFQPDQQPNPNISGSPDIDEQPNIGLKLKAADLYRISLNKVPPSTQTQTMNLSTRSPKLKINLPVKTVSSCLQIPLKEIKQPSPPLRKVYQSELKRSCTRNLDKYFHNKRFCTDANVLSGIYTISRAELEMIGEQLFQRLFAKGEKRSCKHQPGCCIHGENVI
eukprot:TRINITY_DN650_c0_g1_i2.p1 TRINITY_DN650_c0_g1~~TRINITY_DN650_c0_g1_i2.p1  ORF type:complete len:170 (-),score=29.48 TRINITY_DN650_c0_g1_i2:224-733(-)